MTNNEKVAKYFEYVKAYENGNPLISDAEFDVFEEEIKKIDKAAVKKVASGTTGSHKHLTPMLSLDKEHVNDEDNFPIKEIHESFERKRKRQNAQPYRTLKKEVSAKYDGNAFNLIYVDGFLNLALSRTDALTGFDKSHKIKYIVPNTIPLQGTVEIRGEMVIKSSLFEKYKKSDTNPDGKANERNYVTGVINSDGLKLSKLKELDFLAYDLRIIRDNGKFDYVENTADALVEFGFPEIKRVFFTDIDTEFESIYNEFLHYRENECPYRLDGFVIKLPETVRHEFGLNDHDPNWALAIKFPAKDQMTTLLSIESNVGSTGELTPVAILEPMELDDTTVTRASVHNWGYVIENGLKPGTVVMVAKAGDIIPQIIKVVSIPDTDVKFEHPKECPSCGSELTLDGVHLLCPNQTCKAKIVAKLLKGLRILNVKEIGDKTIEKFYEAGIYEIYEIFDKVLFNSQYLISTKQFVEGRQLEIIINAIDKIKEVSFEKVIQALAIPWAGKTISKQIARKLHGIDYDESGLTKEVFEKCTTVGTAEYIEIRHFLEVLTRNGIKVVFPKAVTAEEKAANAKSIKFEMTGTPPQMGGLIRKADYIEYLKAYGYVHTSLNADSNMLITSDVNSTTGKMVKVNKLRNKGAEIEVITYEDLINRLRNGSN